ncbi:MAG: glycerol-3-phosphate 1-O-acyltransferase PlsY [Alteraurantiacibacter sp. bin_em_oilr2.035]|uniref:glycerol-3-phosphate 1-O-acyltransferase PlsY n=1 Tax=Aurantiacibacter atlanticus TaxID=1648404 RepID=UPI00065F3E8D|nr:glycerol-3-phosphate 1-O-acyltransferase PlsY [Aurantiacibacter atlanticus]MDF1834198.1 glycerol-3-phosphate 1-O-acyltransferase PlsY [Alteraurantiacibacter sp. bin_em_oilr2.035]
MESVIAFIIGYFCGSIPFGLVLAKAAGKGDIRSIGSGNIGATNVLRTGSKGLAAGTLLLDLVKGFIPVVLATYLANGQQSLHEAAWGPVPLAAAGAVLGHCFPIWLGFKGGKGVATNAGVAFGLAWEVGAAYALVWIAVLVIVRISSVAGMSAVVAATVAAALLGLDQFVPVLIFIALLIIWLHRANVSRLLKGEEPRVGKAS